MRGCEASVRFLTTGKWKRLDSDASLDLFVQVINIIRTLSLFLVLEHIWVFLFLFFFLFFFYRGPPVRLWNVESD